MARTGAIQKENENIYFRFDSRTRKKKWYVQPQVGDDAYITKNADRYVPDTRAEKSWIEKHKNVKR